MDGVTVSSREDERAVYTTPNSLPPTNVDSESPRPKQPKRVSLTRNACFECRRSKCKCDGERPVCGRCSKRSTECTYDVADEGTTKMQQLTQQLKRLDDAYNPLADLFSALQSLPEDHAFAVLNRIRYGEQVTDIVASLAIAVPSNPPSTHGSLQNTYQDQGLPSSAELTEWFPAATAGEEWSSWSQRCEEGGQGRVALLDMDDAPHEKLEEERETG